MLSSEPGGVVDPAARDKYLLQVTAGPSYDASTHRQIPVNGLDAERIENELTACWLKIRIQDYNGLPQGAPRTCEYFSHPMHTSDRYSISFSFIPKADISGSDLVMGFDFDHPVRDRLPPGFKTAMKIVTSMLDPGIYADPYGDEPYLYGPALSSFFAFRIGDHTNEIPVEQQLARFEAESSGVVEEGGDGSGQQIRANQHLPPVYKKRRKHFLDSRALESFTFEKGRLYQADFFNPYLDFANFSLRLPGFSISVVKYIDNKTHALRYVLKNRATGDVLFVVIFNLLFGQQLEDTLEHARKATQPEKTFDESEEKQPQKEQSERLSPHEARVLSSPPEAQFSQTNSESDVDGSDEQSRAFAAATALANSIYTVLGALGFGGTESPSSSEILSKSTSQERDPQTAEDQAEGMSDAKVEQFLKSRHSSAI